MRLLLWSGEVFLGSMVRSGPGTVFVYGADGTAMGTVASLDAAVAFLERRAAP